VAYLLILDGYMSTRPYGFYDPISVPTLSDGYEIFPFTNPWVIFCPKPVLVLDFYPANT
jgi:hypothetical protein